MIAKSAAEAWQVYPQKPAARNLFTIPLFPVRLSMRDYRELVIMGKMDNASKASPRNFRQRLMKYAVGIPPAMQQQW